MIDVFTDIHRYALHSKFEKLKSELNFLMDKNTTFLIGDYVDMKNVKKSMIENAKSCIDYTLNRMGDRYVLGNHELDENASPHTIRETSEGKKVMFTHGDFPMWGKKIAKDWRKKPYGSSTFKRMFTFVWSKIREWLIYPTELDDIDKECIIHYAKVYDVDIVVMGHLHPKKLLHAKDEKDDVEIFVCPRGHSRLPINILS